MVCLFIFRENDYDVCRYPPIDTEDLVKHMPNLRAKRDNIVISFAQFRPEKDHPLQLRVWKRVLNKLPRDSEFWLVGSVRDPDDERIVNELKSLAKQLGIDSTIKFVINKPRKDILDILSQAKVAIHTMKNEHFGIVVAELMASGIVTIAHKSAGPLLDIIGGADKDVGYLATNENEYALFIERAMNNWNDHL